MKKWYYFLGLILLFSCKRENEKQQLNSKSFVKKTIDFAIANKDNEVMELPGLYDSLSHGLPEKSRLILAEELEKRGFKNINSGRGNYPPRGPRIVSKTYQKENCICEVSKIYYSTTTEGYYEMSERISCTDSTTLNK